MSPPLAGDFLPSAAPAASSGVTAVRNDGATSRCAPGVGARFFPAHRAAVNNKCPFKRSSRKWPLSDSRYELSNQVPPDSANLPAVHPLVRPRKNLTGRPIASTIISKTRPASVRLTLTIASCTGGDRVNALKSGQLFFQALRLLGHQKSTPTEHRKRFQKCLQTRALKPGLLMRLPCMIMSISGNCCEMPDIWCGSPNRPLSKHY